MCRIGDGLKSGKFPAILYSNETEQSIEIQNMLDSVGANYTTSDASAESMEKPVLLVDGVFLGCDDVKHVLEIR